MIDNQKPDTGHWHDKNSLRYKFNDFGQLVKPTCISNTW